MNEEKHPFLHGLSKHRGTPPTAIVIFGASGDLTARKLIPALFNLSLDSLLPNDFYLFGFGRKAITSEAFSESTIESILEYSRRPLNRDVWSRVQTHIFFETGEYDDLSAFKALHDKIEGIEKSIGRDIQILFYISTPPGVFKPILENLGASGLASRHRGTALASKIIVEKPFGRDLQSAKELNRIIRKEFAEEQVYRIDHYLGKETVQDLLVQRFANSIFEPIWNLKYVEYVEITVAEDIGIAGRAGYYDHSGALRDMIQNHTMQLLSLVAMEPPISTKPEDIRDEKVKLLKAIQPVNVQLNGGDVVRGQYTEGLIHGDKVLGFREEKGINPHSWTETYVALRLNINNWRWNGVPFYIRSGKRMARRVSEIAIHFRQPPGSLFKESNKFDLAQNTLVIQIQPDEGTTLLLNSKIPGLETRLQPVKMYFRYATTFGSNTPEAYERLILDAIIGDSTLFIRGDETEVSWNLYTPILEVWEEAKEVGMQMYAAGSWGPVAADLMLAERKHMWRKPGF
ncbi:glucose-6-phosphate dehydrogenase [Opitutia bacterium SCGC AG-212-L18]|nr:glucose-6-phosphate dehydrogenase [Opitutae bacterium SCGC AG-212-L18]